MTNILDGRFFHSVDEETMTVEWQGYVIGSPEPGWYLVQLFSWIDGEETNQHIVRFEDMKRWFFYTNLADLKYGAAHGEAGQMMLERHAEPDIPAFDG